MQLYEQLLGASFAALPRAMRDFHARPHAKAVASFDVERAPGWFAALIAGVFGLPRPARGVPVVLEVTAVGKTERWERRFGNKRFDSVQHARDGRLVERAGLVAIEFELRAGETGLHFASQRCSVARIPLPGWLAPAIEATAIANGDGWSMEVCVSTPHFGWLERYGGVVVPAP